VLATSDKTCKFYLCTKTNSGRIVTAIEIFGFPIWYDQHPNAMVMPKMSCLWIKGNDGWSRNAPSKEWESDISFDWL